MAAVNEAIYGLKTKWVEYGTHGVGIPETEKIKLSNFLNTDPATVKAEHKSGAALGCAIYKMKNVDPSWTIGAETFEKSICFVGISGDSPYTSIRFVANKRDPNESGSYPTIKEIGIQRYDIVNSFFTDTITNNFGNGRTGIMIYTENTNSYGESGGSNAYDRWFPPEIYYGYKESNFPYYTADGSTWLYGNRNTHSFITQFPVTRLVAVPMIYCCDTTFQNFARYDLKTYLAEHKTDRPYITYIMMHFYYKYDDEQNRAARTIGLGLSEKIPLFDGNFIQQSGSNGKAPLDPDNELCMPFALGYQGIPIGGYYNNGGDTLGHPYVWPSTSTTQPYYKAYGLLEPLYLKWDLWKIGSSEQQEYPYCNAQNYTNRQITESCRRAIACWGLFFTDSISDAETAALDADEMHCGTLVDGVGYGDYTSGQDNRNQPQFNWHNLSENDYDPTDPPEPLPTDPNSYRDGMDLGHLDGFETATQRYNLLKAQAHQVFAALWSVWDPFDESDPDLNVAAVELRTKKMFLTNNPLDCCIGLKYFPVAAENIGTGSNTAVKLGAVTLHQSGSATAEIQCKMAKNSYIHDCGSVFCAPQYLTNQGLGRTWIDQYVGFELYLPFCGSVKLDVATYIGKWVNVQYHIDYITGACTAYIGIPSNVNASATEFMEIRSGNCAIDVPISGIQQATLEANMFNATQQLKGAAIKGVSSVVGNLIGTGAKVAAKDVPGAVAGAFGTVGSVAGIATELQNAKYNLEHTQLPARMIGSASSLSGAEGYLKPMLIVTEPRLAEIPANYGHTNGYACLKYGVLKNITSGYTEISNIDLSGIAATDEEKALIRSICSSGIYV